MACEMPVINDDKKSIGLNILSWFVPIAGIILYFVNRKEKPIRSKSNLRVAIISICVMLGIALIVALVVGKASYEYDKTHPVLSADDFWAEWENDVGETEEKDNSDLSETENL